MSDMGKEPAIRREAGSLLKTLLELLWKVCLEGGIWTLREVG